ncbi:MAG: peptidoglycan-binding protein, partial [Sulfurovum sp.]
MLKVKKIMVIALGTIAAGGLAQASMAEQLFYNVAGQATNAAGARLGDEIYYGSSRGRAPARRHRRVRHKVRHKAKHRKVHNTVAAPAVAKMTDEKRIQKALTSLGFYKGKIDGEINSFETRSAIKEMNIAYGISDNASLKPEIRDTLIYLGTLFGFDRALISSGTDERTKAKKIQTALKIHGYYHDKIDGAIGSGTRSCISNYKNENGMSPSGTLNYEEEYKLISTAKEKNDKNIESSLASLKSFGQKIAQPTVGVQTPGATTVSSTVQPQQTVV